MNAQGSTVAPAPRGMLRPFLTFMVVQSLVIVAAAWFLTHYHWSVPADVAAVRSSAWMAVVVQALTFTIALLVARQNIIAAWGLGVVLRFAAVGFWAFLGAKSLGLPVEPAVWSLAIFLFISTLVEPLFLNR